MYVCYTGRYVKHNARTSVCSARERYEYGAEFRHGTRDVCGISGVPWFKELCRRQWSQSTDKRCTAPTAALHRHFLPLLPDLRLLLEYGLAEHAVSWQGQMYSSNGEYFRHFKLRIPELRFPSLTSSRVTLMASWFSADELILPLLLTPMHLALPSDLSLISASKCVRPVTLSAQPNEDKATAKVKKSVIKCVCLMFS
jgi:hypothetical protein